MSNINRENLSDRMKGYERTTAGQRLMPLLPACCRLDGRSFHNFTKGMKRPYDPTLTQIMRDVTSYLVETTNATIGYTQSDEITLIWWTTDLKSQIFCDGRIQKMVSLLASTTTLKFFTLVQERIPDKAALLPMFDCRVWNVPTLAEAANVLLWRERDAIKNSISMAARAYFSHKQLFGKSGKEMQEMLWSKHGVNWNGYPVIFKHGSYFARRKSQRPFTAEEIDNLPPLHEARKNPNLMVERTDVIPLELPPLDRVSNKAEVLFEGKPLSCSELL